MTAAEGSVSAPVYRADIVASLDEFLARCARLRHAGSLPFHSEAWLRAWYQTLGDHAGRQPLLVAVQRAGAPGDAALLPLVAERRGVLSVVEFADATVVDYIAPLLAPDWHAPASEAQAAGALWRAVRAALRGHDLFHVHKLLPRTLPEDGDRLNPLAVALHTQPSEMFGNFFDAPATWEDWRQGLPKHQRKELERCWRNFGKRTEARFERIRDVESAMAAFEALDRIQAERMRARGRPYVLDQPDYRAFYRTAIALGLADGSVVLTALKDGDQLVAVLLGAASARRYVGLRQTQTLDPAWKALAPGRLIDEATARLLAEEGATHLDFGIGDYPHKDFFRFARTELLDGCEALSWRGLPAVVQWRLKRGLKRQAWIRRGLARLRGG